ncbi:unnamed protein product [Phytophthora lilii]|uniref:Unnamed protein product n=1 Tax=Phytophthora lilii TaxID=2077276 RepID=A0A9W7DAH8_9STRA|nr:unnamed protein product [Phytophthora lilii]
MFPNFTSLAQREQKRQELLEKAQRRFRQANAKREMYQGASWATDVSNSITTIAKKATATTQTDTGVGTDEAIPDAVKQNLNDIIDHAISQSDLKKRLSDENSQTNPEVSTDPDVNVRPIMVDAGVHAHPDTAEKGFQARPDTTDQKVQVRPTTSDVGVGEDKATVDDTDDTLLSDDGNDEIDEQKRSKQAVAEIFELYPILAQMRIHPLSSNGRQLTKYYIVNEAKTYSGRLNKIVLVPSINWEETYDHIGYVMTNDVRFIAYENEKRERNEMGKEDKNAPYQVWERLRGIKRNLVKVPTDYKQSKQRFLVFDKSTSTTSDQTYIKFKMHSIIDKNKELLESNGLLKKIVPILKGTNKATPFDANGYVWIDGSTIGVFGKESNKIKPSITKKVNWQITLDSFRDMIRERGLNLEMVADVDKELDANDFTKGVGEARQGTMTGVDEDMDPNLSNADNDAKKILTDYYSGLNAKGVKIPFRLKPIVESMSSVKTHPEYYFGEPSQTKPLNIRNGKHKQVSGEALKGLMKNIRWMDTFISLLDGFEELNAYLNDDTVALYGDSPPSFDESREPDQQRRKNLDDNLKILNEAIMGTADHIRTESTEPYIKIHLQKLHDDSERAYQEYGEAQKRYYEAKNAVKGNSSKSARSALMAAKSAMRATKAVFNAKSLAYSNAVNTDGELKGRGLRGAGVAPLEGVVRRGRTYNLNEIQGLATPSAYTYKQLGSKYIRIPDLDAKTLVIVQPNRRKCGPKCQISDSLQSMIRSLVYKNHIDQPTYDKLNIEDKKMFKEILAITHLQYNFHDKLTDPLETLRAEYDKLKGEIKLENDNPSIIKQLKSLTVDIGSYGDNADNNVAELKAIMKNLIIHDRPQKTQAAVWATDLDKSIRKVDASTQTEGGRMWAYQPKKKKPVKTFAL